MGGVVLIKTVLSIYLKVNHQAEITVKGVYVH